MKEPSSPLPFNSVKSSEGNFLRDDNGNDVGVIYDHVDADLIILAVNSYHGMREALKESRRVLGELRGGPHEEPEVLAQVCAALKASEGE